MGKNEIIEKRKKDNKPIGRWGRLHQEYLNKNKPEIYQNLILSNSIWNYLDEINNIAEKRMETLVDQISKELGISASLKDKSKIEWVAKMRDVVIIAEDIVLEEIIYV